jgi:hypothetical protein
VLGPLLLLLYINYFPTAIDGSAISILPADDTSLIITDKTLQIADNWFQSNLCPNSFLKIWCMQFITKNFILPETSISCNSNEITEASHLKFLCLVMDNALSRNLHIVNVINKLTRVCYMIRSVKPYMSFSSLIMIYYCLFHSSLSYGI